MVKEPVGCNGREIVVRWSNSMLYVTRGGPCHHGFMCGSKSSVVMI